MLGFLSKENDSSSKVKKEQIAFVFVPDGKSLEEIKILISPKARLFADTLNLDQVYLHLGKDTIIYDYKI